MMRRLMLAAAAAFGLAACGQGSGPPLPKTQEGAQAPSAQTGGSVRQANLTPQERQQLAELVGSYLNDVQRNYGGSMSPAAGFSDEVADLQPGADHRWQISLVGGRSYRIIGACDNECSNVDIELIDVSTGGVVASDMLADDFPVVDYTPTANGQFIVRILMQTCTVAPCYAGARVLGG
jgi:hypothetical protein